MKTDIYGAVVRNSVAQNASAYDSQMSRVYERGCQEGVNLILQGITKLLVFDTQAGSDTKKNADPSYVAKIRKLIDLKTAVEMLVRKSS